MIEQDAAGGKHAVRFAVVHHHPVRIQLGDAVGASGIERCCLCLRHLLHLTEHLGGGRLVEADTGVDDANRLQHIYRTQPRYLTGGKRLFKGHSDEALRGEIVYFIRFRGFHQPNAVGKIGKVMLDQLQLRMRIEAQLLDAPEINRAGAAIGSDHMVAFLQQELRQVSAILTGDARNNRFFHSI